MAIVLQNSDGRAGFDRERSDCLVRTAHLEILGNSVQIFSDSRRLTRTCRRGTAALEQPTSHPQSLHQRLLGSHSGTERRRQHGFRPP